MPPDEAGGQEQGHDRPDYAGMRIAARRWAWWMRLVFGSALIGAVAVHELADLGFLDVLVMGILMGIVIDRFVLWPMAVFIARLDDRFRPR